MITYAECEAEFARARCKRRGRPIANHTRIRRMTGAPHYPEVGIGETAYAIVYHSTPIVVVHGDGTYTLDSGGWRTRTTMQRIEAYSPALLAGSCFGGWPGRLLAPGNVRTSSQGGHPWMLYRQGWYDSPDRPEFVGVHAPGRRAYLRAWRAFERSAQAPFYDGVRIGADGWPVANPQGAEHVAQALAQDVQLAALRPRAETAAMQSRRLLRESLRSGDPFTLGDPWQAF